MGSKAAQHAYGEIDDFLDQIKMKIEKIERSFDRVIALGTRPKNKVERDRVIEGIQRDVEKCVKDLYKAEETDLKKMHEEKRELYTDRLVKLKVKINKQKAKLEQVKSGAAIAPSNPDFLQEPLLQDGRDDVELMDIEKADKNIVGEAGLML